MTIGGIEWMTYVYYDKTGRVREFVTDFPPRKGTEKHTLGLIFESEQESEDVPPIPVIKIRLPDGTESGINAKNIKEIIPFDPDRPLRFLKYYTTYHIHTVEIPQLGQSGVWILTATVNGVAYGDYNFYVSDNANGVDGTFTFSDYYSVMTKINELSQKITELKYDKETHIIRLIKG